MRDVIFDRREFVVRLSVSGTVGIAALLLHEQPATCAAARSPTGAKLRELTRSVFAECIGEAFCLHGKQGQILDAELIEVRTLAQPYRMAPGRREPFSVLFRCSASQLLSQRIYRLDHKQIGSLEIFLVPVGQRDQNVRYEAVFN